jgi:transcriptional regulator with GAF, ATPase, and Fis domain
MIDENEFFRRASLRICGDLEIEKALHHCFLYLAEFIPAVEMSVFLTDREFHANRMIAVASADGGEMVNKIVPLPPKAISALEGSNLPDIRIVNNPLDDPVVEPMHRFLGHPSESSLIIMFLTTRGQRMGSAAVVLRAQGLNRYKPEHLHLFSLLNEPFAIAISNHLRHMEIRNLKDLLADDNRFLYQELKNKSSTEIVGGDFGLKPVMIKVRHVAPQRTTVLLEGETGVGKEVIADAIQRYSPRANDPYIKVNCGAISPMLLDSELFGHEKGAFTGATNEKKGRFERAHGGTIFLDEVGELTPEAQLRLLRVLENREVERVGGTKTIKVDVRIIAATHRNLEELLRLRQFREDLWFRLNVFPIHIPPLRARTEDIPALVEYFMKNKAKALNLKGLPRLGSGAISRLMGYSWPGNVRELQNVVERALILNQEEPLSFNELEIDHRSRWTFTNNNGQRKIEPLDEVMASHINKALGMAKGKINGADGCSAMLGLKPNTLRHRMKQLGIPYGRKVRLDGK